MGIVSLGSPPTPRAPRIFARCRVGATRARVIGGRRAFAEAVREAGRVFVVKISGRKRFAGRDGRTTRAMRARS